MTLWNTGWLAVVEQVRQPVRTATRSCSTFPIRRSARRGNCARAPFACAWPIIFCTASHWWYRGKMRSEVCGFSRTVFAVWLLDVHEPVQDLQPVVALPDLLPQVGDAY